MWTPVHTEEPLDSTHEDPHRRTTIQVLPLQSDVQAGLDVEKPHPDTRGREAVPMHPVLLRLSPELQPNAAHEDAHGRRLETGPIPPVHHLPEELRDSGNAEISHEYRT